MDQWIAVAQEGVLVGLFDPQRRLEDGADWVPQGIYHVGQEVRLLAPPDTALHQVLTGFQQSRIDPLHPEPVEREAAACIAADGLDDPTLQDLRQLPFVTIDNQDSRDLDQALWLERDGEGFRVLYALADAAYYVRPGSALFDEALARGTTFYAPGMAAPMLPPSLSEGLVSLNPDVDRRALVFDLRVDHSGESRAVSVYQARIRSCAKLSYPGVQAWLDHRSAGKAHDYDSRDFADSLSLLPELGQLRMEIARQRNVVEHNRREVQMRIDPADPGRFQLQLRQRNDVERYNEQISLLCNMQGAQLLLRAGKLSEHMQAIFRVHLPPAEQRFAALRDTLDSLCELHQLGPLWRWDGRRPLADYLSALPGDAQWQPLRRVVERQIMLCNQASEFSAEPGPHHALGVDGYARFSSPMREIAGIFTHKELLEAQGALSPQPVAQDMALRERVIEAANTAKKTQRTLEKRFQLQIIEQYLHSDLDRELAQRPVRAATVMGMRGSRIYLAVEGLSLDIKLYAEDLQRHYDCRYEVGDTTAVADCASAPTLRIGDAVQLKTQAWNEQRQRFLFELQ